ncbi:MAG: DUF3987 domain-containing protein [Prochloraceae cyanobacterium]|nr:DUF3987 domain-containing protein [Prochloraceae cyanobacterium]
MKLNNIQKRLKSSLEQYPQYWAITTIDANKRPYRPDWQKEPPLSRKYIEDAIVLGEEVQYTKKDGSSYKVRKCPQGLGLRTGEHSNGTLAIDFDGASSIPLYEKLFGKIPVTASFTSRLIAELSPGKLPRDESIFSEEPLCSDKLSAKEQQLKQKGFLTKNKEHWLPTRFQILLIIPQQKWKGLKNRAVFKTGVIGKDGKEELLELRWNNSQSVLPGSVHPETGLYSWVPGRSFEEVGVAIANNKIIDALKEKQPLPIDNVTKSNPPVVNKKPVFNTSVLIPEACNWSETDWVAYYLARLSPSRADNYQSWLEVGMAAKSHSDDSLLQVWDDWSRNSPKYKAGECDRKWNSFKRAGLTIASIYQWGKEDNVAHPCLDDFVRCVEQLYDKYTEGDIDRASMNDQMFMARKNFWSWRLSDEQWKNLVDDVIARLPIEYTGDALFEKIYGTTKLKNTRGNKNHEFGFGNSSTNNNGSTGPDTSAIILLIQEILARYADSEANQIAKLIDLAEELKRPYRDIELLTRVIKKEGEEAEEVIEAICFLQRNMTSFRKRLPKLEHYIHMGLAKLLTDTADAMPTAVEYLFNTVLATCASRIGTSSRIVINPNGGYIQPCILWTANINHSGQAKTPPQKTIVKPLERLEEEANAQYEEELEDYNNRTDNSNPPPLRKRYLLKNCTTSLKIRIHSENKRGVLEYIDEMASDFNRLNQYKSGKGDDLQVELEFFNGDGTCFDRSDARLFLPRTAFSKTGTYQWETLAKLMADKDNFIASGYGARFLFCSIVDAPLRKLDLFSNNNAAIVMGEKLKWLYEQLEKLPVADYLLDDLAKKLFTAWNHLLVDAEIAEKNYAMSLVYSKIESYTARIALWLHLVNSVCEGNLTPAPTISGQTMKNAIEIASFYLTQHRLIFTHNGTDNQLEGNLLKIQTSAEKFYQSRNQGVSASYLKSRINSLKKMSVDGIRLLWKKLVAAGFGLIRGVGMHMVYIPFIDGMPPDGDNGGSNNNGSNNGGSNNGGSDNNGSNNNGSNNSGNNSTSNVYETIPLVNTSVLTETLATTGTYNTLNTNNTLGAVGAVGGELVGAPTDEGITNKELQTPVGEIGARQISPSLTSAIVEKTQTQTLNFFDDQIESATSTEQIIEITNFTNSTPQPLENNTNTAIGATASSPPAPPIANQIDSSIKLTNATQSAENSEVDQSSNESLSHRQIADSTQHITIDSLELFKYSRESELPVELKEYIASGGLDSDKSISEIGELLDTCCTAEDLDLMRGTWVQSRVRFQRAASTLAIDKRRQLAAWVKELDAEIDGEHTSAEEETNNSTAAIDTKNIVASSHDETSSEPVVGDRVKAQIGGQTGIIQSIDRDYIATIELDNGEIVRWFLHRVDKVSPAEQSSQITWQQITQASEREIARIGWSLDAAKNYLVSKFGVRSRQELSDEQLFELVNDLKALGTA